MRLLILCLLLSACGDRALEPCCIVHDNAPQADVWICHNNACPELSVGKECTTLADTDPTYCQVPLTNTCVTVYLDDVKGLKRPFQTVYCF